MDNREYRNNCIPGIASRLTAESFKVRAMQAANEMLDDIENFIHGIDGFANILPE